MRISLCSIHVSDPAHAFRFYTDVLGFDTYATMPEHNVYIVRAPGQDVGLLLEPIDVDVTRAYTRKLRQDAIPVIVFGVEDLDAEVERLRARGVAVGKIFEDPSGRGVNIDDSVGNVVQIHEGAE